VARKRHGVVAAAFAALTGSLVLPVAVAPTVFLSQAGCAGNDCDADTQTWGSCTQGELAGGDPNTWESGPICGQYLDFHGERTWTFDPSPWMGSRMPITISGSLSFDASPCAEGGQFAPPAGNLTEIMPIQVGNKWKFTVLNDTCAQYYLRVVATYADVDAGAAGKGTCQSVDGGS
jgi:hypothetical protein